MDSGDYDVSRRFITYNQCTTLWGGSGDGNGGGCACVRTGSILVWEIPVFFSTLLLYKKIKF